MIECIQQTDRDTERVVYQGNWVEEKVFEKRKVFNEDLKELTGRMTDRNRELVPNSWSQVRDRALTTGWRAIKN